MTRIYGLDLWRSGLLLVGPLIHSTSPGYISDASSLFRMQVFFFIAGFLSAHASEKQADWTVRRYVQLGVPVITVWLFVLIPTKILVGKSSFEDLISPDHLWFMIDLIIATFATTKSKFVLNIVSKLLTKNPVSLVCGFVCISSFLSTLQYPIEHTPFYYLVIMMLKSPLFILCYVAGAIVYKNKEVFGLIDSWQIRFISVVVVLLVYTAMILFGGLIHTHGKFFILKLVLSCATGLTGSLSCLFVISSSIKINWRPRIVAILSKSSYSIYLFHLPFILLISYYLSDNISHKIYFLLLSSGSFFASWALHYILISRSHISRLAFNGVMPVKFARP